MSSNRSQARNYYSEITIDDLDDAQADDRIVLDMQDQQRYFQGRAEEDEEEDMDADVNDRIIEETRNRFADWRPDLGNVRRRFPRSVPMSAMLMIAQHRVSRKVASAATVSILDALRLRQAGREGSTFSKDVLIAMSSSQAATNEFLRQFWAAVLPPKADDHSANAMATPKERYEKATRLKGYLDKTRARVDAVVSTMPEEEKERVREVRLLVLPAEFLDECRPTGLRTSSASFGLGSRVVRC